ncbi:hypothetical protein [Streptomyces sp. AC602_WCS936]|uniref:hypothetical protein n=1 Tax=Streptomyces sp. AC602_WCS936 TaxID=2823685 RepID=UPI001C26F092|nr:hypothetical protein [Streptomyces sp. AC602_WCS936]
MVRACSSSTWSRRQRAARKIQARRGSDPEQERSVKIFGSQRVFDVLSGRPDVAEGWRDLSELLFR